MRALLDVNVLIALLDVDHTLHRGATDWFRSHAKKGWASCPITQNGCMRILSNPGYPNPLAVPLVADRLQGACADSLHRFWPDDVSLLDPRSVDATRIHGPRQLTDIYLLALAVRHEGCFVTFDATVAASAVKGARAQHLVSL